MMESRTISDVCSTAPLISRLLSSQRASIPHGERCAPSFKGSNGSKIRIWNTQARAKELRLELLNSARLKAHFEAHPGDLALLRHDKPLARAPPAPHLKRLPAYLQDPATQAVQQNGSAKPGEVLHCVPAAVT